MATHEDTRYECYACDRAFRSRVFSLNRQFERVTFGSPMPIVSVEHADGLACYCSASCMNLHYPREMVKQQVPIPALQPDVGPVEVCAICKGPVDMTRLHLTFILEECKDMGWCFQPTQSDCIAVVCDVCVPVAGEAAGNAVERREQAGEATGL